MRRRTAQRDASGRRDLSGRNVIPTDGQGGTQGILLFPRSPVPRTGMANKATGIARKAMLYSGIAMLVTGFVFLLQSEGTIGPESSFMYKNPEWYTNGKAIMLGGAGLCLAAIFMRGTRQQEQSGQK